MLTDLLSKNKCFKLVCGAGNENIEEVERLVFVYSRAGCTLFDLSANIDVIRAAKRGIFKSGISKDRYLSVSLGIKGDPHTQKAEINSKQCTRCGICMKTCPQGAIFKNDSGEFYIEKGFCIGCKKCLNICPSDALFTKSYPSDINKIIPKIIEEGIDCLEFHASIEDENEVITKWQTINTLYSGLLSICIDRSNLGNKQLISRLKKMIEFRTPYSTIVQADGLPMSGGTNNYGTTLQAVATAEIVQNEKLPVYLMISGGTNSKTKELANLCEVFPNGIAIGSYARKIVHDYIKREDFYTNNQIQNNAIEIAKQLVDSCLYL